MGTREFQSSTEAITDGPVIDERQEPTHPAEPLLAAARCAADHHALEHHFLKGIFPCRLEIRPPITTCDLARQIAEARQAHAEKPRTGRQQPRAERAVPFLRQPHKLPTYLRDT